MNKPKTLQQLKDEEHKVYQRFDKMMNLNGFSTDEMNEFSKNLNDYVDIQVEINMAIQRVKLVGERMAKLKQEYFCYCGNQLKTDQELRDKICEECV